MKYFWFPVGIEGNPVEWIERGIRNRHNARIVESTPAQKGKEIVKHFVKIIKILIEIRKLKATKESESTTCLFWKVSSRPKFEILLLVSNECNHLKLLQFFQKSVFSHRLKNFFVDPRH